MEHGTNSLGMDNFSRALKPIMGDGVNNNQTTTAGANHQTTGAGIKATVTTGGANNPQTTTTDGVNQTMAVVTGIVTTTDGELLLMNDCLMDDVIGFILFLTCFIVIVYLC